MEGRRGVWSSKLVVWGGGLDIWNLFMQRVFVTLRDPPESQTTNPKPPIYHYWLTNTITVDNQG